MAFFLASGAVKRLPALAGVGGCEAGVEVAENGILLKVLFVKCCDM